MARLCGFNQEHPEFTPTDALVKLYERMSEEHRRMQIAQAQGQQSFNPVMAQQQHLQQPPQPQFQGPNQYLSPAQAAHPNLPGTHAFGSPATLSNHNTPAMPNLALQQQQSHQQNVMAAPGPPGSSAMAHQASHQGTNPSAAGTPAAGSANASPNVNVTGKRRRASGVNIGAEDGMDSVNGIGAGSGGGGGTLVGTGQKVKQSPRVGGKRQKGS
jgi:hypothetical protein